MGVSARPSEHEIVPRRLKPSRQVRLRCQAVSQAASTAGARAPPLALRTDDGSSTWQESFHEPMQRSVPIGRLEASALDAPRGKDGQLAEDPAGERGADGLEVAVSLVVEGFAAGVGQEETAIAQ